MSLFSHMQNVGFLMMRLTLSFPLFEVSHNEAHQIDRKWTFLTPQPKTLKKAISFTVMILSFRTDRSEQTVQSQIRLLPKELSDQGLHCLQFHLHQFDKIPFRVWPLCLNFR